MGNLNKTKARFRVSSDLIIFMIVGVSISLVFSPFSGQPFDVSTWYQVTMEALSAKTISGDMAVQPAFFYTLLPIAHLYSILNNSIKAPSVPLSLLPNFVQSAASWALPPGAPVIVPNWLFLLLLKIPFILGDCGVGILVYKIVLPKYGKKPALTAFILWFLNPMTIWVSGIWGMFDSLPAFFTLLSTYFLIQRKYFFSSSMLGIAIAFKLYPLFVIFPMLLYAKRCDSASFKKLIKFLVVSFASSLMFFIQWFGDLKIQLNAYMIQPIGAPAGIQTFGLTYWNLNQFESIDGALTRLISLVSMLALTVMIYALVYVKLKQGSTYQLFFWQFASIAIVFLTFPQVNEQWFIWLLPFLVLLTAGVQVIGKLLVALLSIIALAYSWVSSLFAAFFLPVATQDLNLFRMLFETTNPILSIRLVTMEILGVAFSSLLLVSMLVIFPNEFVWAESQTKV